MDDKQTSNTPAPGQGNVMDIQPPRPDQAAAPSAPVVQPQTSPTPITVSPGSSATPQPETVAPAPVPEQQNTPVTAEPSISSEQSKAGLSPELLAQAQAETNKPENTSADGKNPSAAKKPHKPRGPLVAVVAAVFVAVLLSGVAIYAYMQSQEKDSDHMDTHSSTEHENMDHSNDSAEPASTKEVEDTAKELDEAINTTDESQEIPESGLSEEAIGL